MKPSGRPRITARGAAGTSKGWILLVILSAFTSAAFPPFLLVVAAATAFWGLIKWIGHRDVRKRERSHRERMDDFYRQQAADQRTFVNPGWQV